MADPHLSAGEHELVAAAQFDDIDMAWALEHLGIRANDGTFPLRPSIDDIDLAFTSLERLVGLGLIGVGRTAYIDGGPPGRLAPVYLHEEPLDVVRQRVIDSVQEGADHIDWRFS